MSERVRADAIFRAVPIFRAIASSGSAVLLAAGGAILMAASVTGCARAHAKTTPQPPPLEVPAPPPHLTQAAEAEMPPPAELVEEPPKHSPAVGAVRRPQTPVRTEIPKPEPSPAPAEPSKPVEEPQRPLTLQMPTVGTDKQITQAVHEQLTRAGRDLNRIDVGRLDPSAKTQYDTAVGIIRQAREALDARNLVFAKSLADKAVALAAQLAGGR